MKKKYFKRITGIALLIITVIAYVHIMQISVINMNDDDSRMIKSFYLEEPDSLDYVVMGASEITHGYSPADAYRATGLTSGKYAFSINSVLLWKYELEEIERTQHPKVLVIETNGALYEEDKYLESDYCISLFTESIPLSLNRVKASFAMSDHPLERLFPFIKYHYKWKNIAKITSNTDLMLRLQGHARLRGAVTNLYRIKQNLNKIHQPDDKTAKINSNAEKALGDFLESCRASGIEHIIFAEFPHITNDETTYNRQKRANYVERMVTDAGFDYINLNDKAYIDHLDYSKDFFDLEHMLAPGSKTTSELLAETILSKYIEQPKDQSEKNKAEWDESAGLIAKYHKLYSKKTSGPDYDPFEKRNEMLIETKPVMEEIEGM